MKQRWQITALLAPLVLVEASSGWKLAHWLKWGNESWLSATTAVAFISLLLSAIIALSLDVTPRTRRHIFLGGVWLFLIQGLANVLMSYQYSLTAMPTQVVTSFFALSAAVALKITAILQGASLSVVSISFWSVLAQMLRSARQERASRRTQLQGLEEFLKEVKR